MRGKDFEDENFDPEDRITPAYAGKSSLHMMTALSRRDHPRLCGEKSDTADEQHWKKGSPPPMRGKAVKHLKWP